MEVQVVHLGSLNQLGCLGLMASHLDPYSTTGCPPSISSPTQLQKVLVVYSLLKKSYPIGLPVIPLQAVQGG